MGDRRLNYYVGDKLASVAKIVAWGYACLIILNSRSLLSVATAIGIASGTHAIMTAVQAVIDLVCRKPSNHD